jgi:hypothetical protein
MSIRFTDRTGDVWTELSFGAPKPATDRRPKPATVWGVLDGRILLFEPVGKGCWSALEIPIQPVPSWRRPEPATQAAWSRAVFPYARPARFQFTVNQELSPGGHGPGSVFRLNLDCDGPAALDHVDESGLKSRACISGAGISTGSMHLAESFLTLFTSLLTG